MTRPVTTAEQVAAICCLFAGGFFTAVCGMDGYWLLSAVAFFWSIGSAAHILVRWRPAP
jgi:hypothetical protein